MSANARRSGLTMRELFGHIGREAEWLPARSFGSRGGAGWPVRVRIVDVRNAYGRWEYQVETKDGPVWTAVRHVRLLSIV